MYSSNLIFERTHWAFMIGNTLYQWKGYLISRCTCNAITVSPSTSNAALSRWSPLFTVEFNEKKAELPRGNTAPINSTQSLSLSLFLYHFLSLWMQWQTSESNPSAHRDHKGIILIFFLINIDYDNDATCKLATDPSELNILWKKTPVPRIFS